MPLNLFSIKLPLKECSLVHLFRGRYWPQSRTWKKSGISCKTV